MIVESSPSMEKEQIEEREIVKGKIGNGKTLNND